MNIHINIHNNVHLFHKTLLCKNFQINAHTNVHLIVISNGNLIFGCASNYFHKCSYHVNINDHINIHIFVHLNVQLSIHIIPLI